VYGIAVGIFQERGNLLWSDFAFSRLFWQKKMGLRILESKETNDNRAFSLYSRKIQSATFRTVPNLSGSKRAWNSHV
jgi:hypothetical protein